MDLRNAIEDVLLDDMGYTSVRFTEKVSTGKSETDEEYYFVVNHRGYGRYEIKVVPSQHGSGYEVYRQSDEVDSYQGHIYLS